MALYGRDTENVERTGRMTLMSDAWNGLRGTHDLDRWMMCATLEPEQDLHGQLDYKALRTLARGDIRHLV